MRRVIRLKIGFIPMSMGSSTVVSKLLFLQIRRFLRLWLNVYDYDLSWLNYAPMGLKEPHM